MTNPEQLLIIDMIHQYLVDMLTLFDCFENKFWANFSFKKVYGSEKSGGAEHLAKDEPYYYYYNYNYNYGN